ncbi:Fur family transcriptional regulator, partial [Campylobacter coli]
QMPKVKGTIKSVLIKGICSDCEK